MIKFKKGQLEIKLLDTTIIVYNNKRNVFNLLGAEDIETLNKLETSLKECKDSFNFRIVFNNKKDILKIALNGAIYSLNAILI